MNVNIGPSKCWLDSMTRGLQEWIKNPEEFERKAKENYAKHWSNVTVNTEEYYTIDQYGMSKLHKVRNDNT
jgi:hypothetical protein